LLDVYVLVVGVVCATFSMSSNFSSFKDSFGIPFILGSLTDSVIEPNLCLRGYQALAEADTKTKKVAGKVKGSRVMAG